MNTIEDNAAQLLLWKFDLHTFAVTPCVCQKERPAQKIKDYKSVHKFGNNEMGV